MSNLSQIPSRDEILAELDRVLKSDEFRKGPTLRETLAFLVKQATQDKLEGEIDEPSIWKHLYPKEEFDSTNPKVRVAVNSIRTRLPDYYKKKGSDNSIRILLDRGSYTPTFKRQLQLPLAPDPTPPPDPRDSRTRGISPFNLIGFVAVSMAVLFACFLWLSRFRPCSGPITITEPKIGRPVPRKFVVQATRPSAQFWLCRCNDYLVVEAVDIGQWYVQGRLPDGEQPSFTATFGDAKTPPGTRFNVFILSTKEELTLAPLSQSSPVVASATKSPTVEVMLQSN